MKKFSDETSKQLGWYVYRLVDPRSGVTFYVGKGCNNRLFDHSIATNTNDLSDYKTRIIRQINLANLQIIYIIHRHGIKDEKTAFEVEAALIDAYAGLSNKIRGNGSSEFGMANVEEIMSIYESEMVEINDKAVIISINKSALEKSIYDATRFAWKININEACKAEFIIATVQGIIKGVFIAHEWKEATAANFPELKLIDEDIYDESIRLKRFGFIGESASKEILDKYINKRIPDKFRKKGASNPIKYSWKVKD